MDEVLPGSACAAPTPRWPRWGTIDLSLESKMDSFDQSSEKSVYLMRGLPSCGKTFTARQLAGDRGVVCETDEYFRTQIGEDTDRLDDRAELIDAARRWNFGRFQEAVQVGLSPIVVDRGNALSLRTRQYARYAVDHGYHVELKEPTWELWHEIRVLLKYKDHTKEILYEWAEWLAKMNQATHGVPVSAIRQWIDHWKWDLTVEEILTFEPYGDGPTESEPVETP